MKSTLNIGGKSKVINRTNGPLKIRLVPNLVCPP
jgi:hypothetical protein